MASAESQRACREVGKQHVERRIIDRRRADHNKTLYTYKLDSAISRRPRMVKRRTNAWTLFWTRKRTRHSEASRWVGCGSDWSASPTGRLIEIERRLFLLIWESRWEEGKTQSTIRVKVFCAVERLSSRHCISSQSLRVHVPGLAHGQTGQYGRIRGLMRAIGRRKMPSVAWFPHSTCDLQRCTNVGVRVRVA